MGAFASGLGPQAAAVAANAARRPNKMGERRMPCVLIADRRGRVY